MLLIKFTIWKKLMVLNLKYSSKNDPTRTNIRLEVETKIHNS